MQIPTLDECIAYHEAGHAVIAHLLGITVLKVHIDTIAGVIPKTICERVCPPQTHCVPIFRDEEAEGYEHKPLPGDLGERWDKDLKARLGGYYGTRHLFTMYKRIGFEVDFDQFLKKGSVAHDEKVNLKHLRFRYADEQDVARERARLERETEDLIAQESVLELIEKVAAALQQYRILEGKRLEDALNGRAA